MKDDQPSLYMIQLRARADRLAGLGRNLRVPLRDADSGYLVHGLLRGLFGDFSPKLFSLLDMQKRELTILAYTTRTADDLRAHVDRYAEPELHAVCDWNTFASKPMPTAWPPSSRLGFELRACPVVRKASKGPYHRKGAEVDVFISKCWDTGDSLVPVDRQTVYRQWLTDQLDRLGGATLDDVRVVSYQRERLLRRTQGQSRKAKLLDRPVVRFSGTLEVTDGDTFNELLRRGVGRHRAFGFGMVLLRPPKGS